jgi:REP element-mobilizing transposase RayT
MDNSPAHKHRRSIRLKEYDYASPGAYFVTVVTYQRTHFFGEVIDAEMQLNQYGVIAKNEWFESSILRPYVELFPEEFIVMPNHNHGIIWINEIETHHNSRGAASLRPYMNSNNPSDLHRFNVAPKSLGAIVRAYKSSVTYRINKLRNSPGLPVWQRNYYEHIIRDQNELQSTTEYILTNPDHWYDDPENPHPTQRNLP